MPSIKTHIDGLIIANQVRLERANHSGSFLLVEGAADAKFIERFCDADACSIVICVGKDNLFEAIESLESSNFQGALGFSDRDFADILGLRECEGNVVYTDENDIELMLLSSKSLEMTLKEFGNEVNISKTTETEGKSVREMIFESASVVGSLRLVSQLNSWSLRFSGMSYKFVGSNSCLLDRSKTIKHILGRSDPINNITEDNVVVMVEAVMSQAKFPKELCQGHDCVRVLGRGLKTQFGKTNSFNNTAGAKILEGILRLAYKFSDFCNSKAYGEIRRWEKETGYSILVDA